MTEEERRAAFKARIASLPGLAAGLFLALSQPTAPIVCDGARWSSFLSLLEAQSKIDPSASFWSDEEEESDESTYRVTADGTAIIPVYGMMLDTAPDWWLSYIGACSTPQITGWVSDALADANVKRVLLDIDSPGGHSAGVATLADAIFSLSASGKPVWSMGREICSAAYWVGSQADRIVARRDALIGCIGTVILGLVDVSKMYADQGMERVIITSTGAEVYKGAGMRGAPITPAQRADFKRMCDECQALFNQGIARGRGLDIEAAQALADGRSFLGYASLDLGLKLIDELGDPEEVLARFGAEATGAKDPPPVDESPSDFEAATRKKRWPASTNPSSNGGNQPGDARTGGREQPMTLKERILAAMGGSESNEEKLEAAATQIEALTTENKQLKEDLARLRTQSQQSEDQKLKAARESAERAAVAALGQQATELASAKATIEATADLTILATLEGAWKKAAAPIGNPTAQSQNGGGDEKNLYDKIRDEVDAKNPKGKEGK